MPSRRKSLLKILVVVAATPLFLLVGLLAIAVATVQVGGTADLPNGAVATIKGSFAASTGPDCSWVKIAGRKFVFTKTEITTEGVTLCKLDESVEQVTLTSHWGRVELTCDGEAVPLPEP